MSRIGLRAWLVAAAVVTGAVVAGCSAGSDVGGPVCAAYLRYNDAIAEAHDVTDLRKATEQLRAALPQESSDPKVAAAGRGLDSALTSGSKDPSTYLQAASGVASICDFSTR